MNINEMMNQLASSKKRGPPSPPPSFSASSGSGSGSGSSSSRRRYDNNNNSSSSNDGAGSGGGSGGDSEWERRARFEAIEREEEEEASRQDEEEEDGDEEEGGGGRGDAAWDEGGVPAQLSEHQVQQWVDRLPEMDAPSLDLPGLKRMILRLEKSIRKNQELRIKYPEEPERFMESEADLDEELKKLQTLAAVPSLYSHFIQLNGVSSILGLLTHENADIANDVVDLLRELTDSDNAEESEYAAALVDAVMENQGLSMLMQNLRRLEEKAGSDSQGVFNTLFVIENFTDIKPELQEALVKDTDILPWLLGRLKTKTFDQNKQYAAEILAILLQNSKSNREAFGELNGVDTLLQCVAQYKRKDPNGSDETELLQNLFGCLCSGLLEVANKERFLAGEGLELMQILIREKKLARIGAFKTLSYAMNDTYSTSLCNRFIDIGGLKTLFSAFMKKGAQQLQKTYKDNYSPTQEEEYVVSIIASLLKYATEEDRHNRLLVKFVENNFEKIDCLVDLHTKYLDQVSAVDDEIAAELQGKEATEDEKDDFYLRRLDGGLFTLQLIDFIFGAICASSEHTIKEYAFGLMRLRRMDVQKVADVLSEYEENVGELATEEVRQRERAQIRALVESLSDSDSAGSTATAKNGTQSASASHQPPAASDSD